MQLFFYQRRFTRQFVCSFFIVSSDRVNVDLLLWRSNKGDRIFLSTKIINKNMLPFGQQVDIIYQIYSITFGMNLFNFNSLQTNYLLLPLI